MKPPIIAAATLIAAASSFADTPRPADQAFLEQVARYGVGQANWDSAEFVALTFPNAYRFTRYYVVEKGERVAPNPWQDAEPGLNLSQISASDADGVHDMETLLRDRLKNHTLVVLKGDRLLHQHFWNGMDQKSTHLDMSVTKSFTAMLAGIAAAEGKLDMTRPVEFYLPDFAGTAFEGVAVQDVADMNSGLDIETPPFLSWDPKFTQSQEWNGPNDSGLNGIVDYLRTIDQRKYDPGTHYQYQDPNTEILGVIVEQVTGTRLAEYMQQKLWSKLGAEQDAFWMADVAGYAIASGGLNMTTRDLARVGQMLLNNGRNHLGEQVVPEDFLQAVWVGNDRVRATWSVGKEAPLAPDSWYKDQIRVLNIKGHKVMAFVGIHGQVLVVEPTSGVVIAMNGGYPQTETERMNKLLFLEIVPALLAAASDL